MRSLVLHLHRACVATCFAAIAACSGSGTSSGSGAGGTPEAGTPSGGAPSLVVPDLDLGVIKADLDYLAGPECMGRATATVGNELALRYVESAFAEIGLEPAGDKPGSYRQEFPYTKYEQLAPPVVSLAGTSLVSGEDFNVAFYSSSGDVSAEVAFVGYGLIVPPFDPAQYPSCPVAPAGFDEYAGVDVKGRIVAFVSGFPGNEDAFATGCPFQYDSVDRTAAAAARGAAGVVGMWGYADINGHETIRGIQFPPSILPQGSHGIPVLWLDRDVFEAAVPNLRSWVSEVDASMTPRSRALGIEASIKIESRVVDTVSYNLMGVLPGSDPVLSQETVILSGHIDGLGVDEATGVVYPGANDDASGTVATFRLARQVLKKYGRPRRTVVFAVWNGEETGWWGSCYYTNHPARPLASTRAMVNMEQLADGWGPGDSALVQVNGKDDPTSNWLVDLAEAGNAELGTGVGVLPLPATRDVRNGGADDWCFVRKGGVAATTIGGGWFANWHKPTDNVNNVVMDDMRGRMRATWALFAPIALGIEQEVLAARAQDAR